MLYCFSQSVRPRINSLSSNLSTSSSSSSAGGSPPPLGLQFAAMSISGNHTVLSQAMPAPLQQQQQPAYGGFQQQMQRRRSSNSFSEPGVIGERRYVHRE